MRRAKIVCTLGPASLRAGVLEELIRNGMDCARLNFSHGSQEEHLETARRVRQASRNVGRPVSLLADLQGPKIRVGRFPNGSIPLVTGEVFRLTGQDVPCTEQRASVSYPKLARDLRPGDRILLDDGLLEMRVLHTEGEDVVCQVVVGGILSDRKGVNLPGVALSIPALTDKDRSDLEYAVRVVQVDCVALSFVRRAEDVLEAKRGANGTPVIAKLEKPEAIENLLEILDESDGVMVARGDLGVEVGVEKVPLVQKRIIQEANRRGKLVITATQMLDSMIRNPRPTRAEAADVANAILDGSDAVMLSGETATGSYPIESVQTMAAIVREAETAEGLVRSVGEHLTVEGDWEFTSAAAHGAALMSSTLPLAGIVTFTSDGRSAELLSTYRPQVPIYALTTEERVASRLAVRWGISAQVVPPSERLFEAISLASKVLRDRGVAVGAKYALVLAVPLGERSNTVMLQRVEG